MLNLRARDSDQHRVLKVALTTWAAHVGGQALAPFLENGAVEKAYFSPKLLSRYYDHVSWTQERRQEALDHATQGPESLVPIHEREPRLLKMPRLRSILSVS